MSASDIDDQQSNSNPSDPIERAAQTFPRLTTEMAARVASYGTEERLSAGTTLFERGQRSIDFFLILEGRVDISDLDAHGVQNVFASHGERQFTGELDLFNDRKILLSASTGTDCRVVRVKRADFRRMVVSEPDIGELMMRAFILRRVALINHKHGGVILIGAGRSADTLRLKRFLTRNGYPHRLLDTEIDPEAEGFFACFGLHDEQLPAVLLGQDQVMTNPNIPDLADALGFTEGFDPERIYDVAIVGAGPAGLAAAVYAASEGLDTLVIEGTAPGGQAGTSSKIENYLGFPTGISGQALAGRAQVQAQKFGARLAISRNVSAIDCDQRPFKLHLDDGQTVSACSVIIATGARYRSLEVTNHERFEGQGIHYAATAMEGQLCDGEEVIIVGGGNSAGQAAVFLSRLAKHVHILVRGRGLAETMSDYLVQRIVHSQAITLHVETEITQFEGDERLRRVTWTHLPSGASETHAIGNVFLMIGAAPNTEWLEGCLNLDQDGFIVTGKDTAGNRLASAYATSREGIFAVGDVRSGSVKRVASGVGEGSVVIHSVHQFLNPDLA
jgi:thioredoxin reductase (NADPH)